MALALALRFTANARGGEGARPGDASPVPAPEIAARRPARVFRRMLDHPCAVYRVPRNTRRDDAERLIRRGHLPVDRVGVRFEQAGRTMCLRR